MPLSALRCAPLGASPLPFPSPSLRSPPFPSTCFLRKRARSWCLLRSWGHGGSGPRWRRLRGGTPTPVLQKGGAEAEGGPRGEEPQVHRSFLQAANLLQSLYRLHLVREARWGRGLEKEGTWGPSCHAGPQAIERRGAAAPTPGLRMRGGGMKPGFLGLREEGLRAGFQGPREKELGLEFLGSSRRSLRLPHTPG